MATKVTLLLLLVFVGPVAASLLRGAVIDDVWIVSASALTGICALGVFLTWRS